MWRLFKKTIFIHFSMHFLIFKPLPQLQSWVWGKSDLRVVRLIIWAVLTFMRLDFKFTIMTSTTPEQTDQPLYTTKQLFFTASQKCCILSRWQHFNLGEADFFVVHIVLNHFFQMLCAKLSYKMLGFNKFETVKIWDFFLNMYLFVSGYIQLIHLLIVFILPSHRQYMDREFWK